jgi:hypothetical protein
MRVVATTTDAGCKAVTDVGRESVACQRDRVSPWGRSQKVIGSRGMDATQLNHKGGVLGCGDDSSRSVVEIEASRIAGTDLWALEALRTRTQRVTSYYTSDSRRVSDFS